jgi:hypothetical protein
MSDFEIDDGGDIDNFVSASKNIASILCLYMIKSLIKPNRNKVILVKIIWKPKENLVKWNN